MVDQLASMIAISIILTFIGLLSALLLMRLSHIHHPRSRFFIYLIVALTASTLVFAPLFSSSLNEKSINDQEQSLENDSHPVSLMLNYGDEELLFQSPLENIITGMALEETNTTTDEPSDSSLQRAVCIAILYEKFFTNTNNDTFNNILDKYNLKLDEKKIQEASVSTILTEIISLQSDIPLNEISSSKITCRFVLNSESSEDEQMPVTSNAGPSNENKPFYPLYMGVFSLLLLGFIYFFMSLTIGKKMTLRTLHAKKCTNERVLSIIQKVSDEFNIKMPRVYVSNGSPNAFVFGYPITLVISRSLLSLLTENELEMTIRHELSHIKNKDILIKPALQMLRIMQFFNPFIHFIVSRLIREREAMADLVSFTNKKDKITFMEALIKIEEYMIHSPSRSHSPLPFSAPSLWDHIKKQPGLEARFDRLFEETHPKRLLSVGIGFLLIITNISLVAAAYQMTAPSVMNNVPEIEGERPVKTDSFIYECTFIIGNDDITCQEIVMFKSDVNRGSWVQYQTEILPLAPYLFNNPSLCVFPQPHSEQQDPSF